MNAVGEDEIRIMKTRINIIKDRNGRRKIRDSIIDKNVTDKSPANNEQS